MTTADHTVSRLDAFKRRGYVFHLYNGKNLDTVFCEVDVKDGNTLCGEGTSIAAAVAECERHVRDYEARKR